MHHEMHVTAPQNVKDRGGKIFKNGNLLIILPFNSVNLIHLDIQIL